MGKNNISANPMMAFNKKQKEDQKKKQKAKLKEMKTANPELYNQPKKEPRTQIGGGNKDEESHDHFTKSKIAEIYAEKERRRQGLYQNTQDFMKEKKAKIGFTDSIQTQATKKKGLMNIPGYAPGFISKKKANNNLQNMNERKEFHKFREVKNKLKKDKENGTETKLTEDEQKILSKNQSKYGKPKHVDQKQEQQKVDGVILPENVEKKGQFFPLGVPKEYFNQNVQQMANQQNNNNIGDTEEIGSEALKQIEYLKSQQPQQQKRPKQDVNDPFYQTGLDEDYNPVTQQQQSKQQKQQQNKIQKQFQLQQLLQNPQNMQQLDQQQQQKEENDQQQQLQESNYEVINMEEEQYKMLQQGIDITQKPKLQKKTKIIKKTVTKKIKKKIEKNKQEKPKKNQNSVKNSIMAQLMYDSDDDDEEEDEEENIAKKDEDNDDQKSEYEEIEIQEEIEEEVTDYSEENEQIQQQQQQQNQRQIQVCEEGDFDEEDDAEFDRQYEEQMKARLAGLNNQQADQIKYLQQQHLQESKQPLQQQQEQEQQPRSLISGPKSVMAMASVFQDLEKSAMQDSENQHLEHDQQDNIQVPKQKTQQDLERERKLAETDRELEIRQREIDLMKGPKSILEMAHVQAKVQQLEDDKRMQELRKNPQNQKGKNVIVGQSTVRKSQIDLNQNAQKFLPPQLMKMKQMQSQKQSVQQPKQQIQPQQQQKEIYQQSQQQQSTNENTVSNFGGIIQPPKVKGFINNVSNVPRPQFLQKEDVELYKSENQRIQDEKVSEQVKQNQELFRTFMSEIKDINKKTQNKNENQDVEDDDDEKNL